MTAPLYDASISSYSTGGCFRFMYSRWFPRRYDDVRVLLLASHLVRRVVAYETRRFPKAHLPSFVGSSPRFLPHSLSRVPQLSLSFSLFFRPPPYLLAFTFSFHRANSRVDSIVARPCAELCAASTSKSKERRLLILSGGLQPLAGYTRIDTDGDCVS